MRIPIRLGRRVYGLFVLNLDIHGLRVVLVDVLIEVVFYSVVVLLFVRLAARNCLDLTDFPLFCVWSLSHIIKNISRLRYCQVGIAARFLIENSRDALLRILIVVDRWTVAESQGRAGRVLV